MTKISAYMYRCAYMLMLFFSHLSAVHYSTLPLVHGILRETNKAMTLAGLLCIYISSCIEKNISSRALFLSSFRGAKCEEEDPFRQANAARCFSISDCEFFHFRISFPITSTTRDSRHFQKLGIEQKVEENIT
jgi:hypothetical protein